MGRKRATPECLMLLDEIKTERFFALNLRKTTAAKQRKRGGAGGELDAQMKELPGGHRSERQGSPRRGQSHEMLGTSKQVPTSRNNSSRRTRMIRPGGARSEVESGKSIRKSDADRRASRMKSRRTSRERRGEHSQGNRGWMVTAVDSASKLDINVGTHSRRSAECSSHLPWDVVGQPKDEVPALRMDDRSCTLPITKNDIGSQSFRRYRPSIHCSAAARAKGEVVALVRERILTNRRRRTAIASNVMSKTGGSIDFRLYPTPQRARSPRGRPGSSWICQSQ